MTSLQLKLNSLNAEGQTISLNRQVSIAGRISNAQTEKAIAGAWVEIITMPAKFARRCQLKSLKYSAWEQMVERIDRTLTASDGFFYFADLIEGDYTLRVSVPGMATRYNVREVSTTVSDSDKDKQVLQIALTPTTIKGKITNSDNQPVAMARVQLADSLESTLSDSEGNYLLWGLEANPDSQNLRPVKIIASASGYQMAEKNFSIALGEVKTINFSLASKQ